MMSCDTSNSEKPIKKVLILGLDRSGKTSILLSFREDINLLSFLSLNPTKHICIENFDTKEYILNIWDFGGDVKYRLLFPSYVNGASAALILYDTTNRESLDDIKNWVQLIRENTDYDNTVKILIGTKIDLEDQRVIPKPEAFKISKQYGCSVCGRF